MLTVDQGIDDIKELEDLSDDEVKSLLKLLRSPGGTVRNPSSRNPGQPAHITAPGISVSLKASSNLYAAVYYLRHLKRTSRKALVTDVTTKKVKELKSLRAEEKSHEDPSKPPKIDSKNWPKTLEAVAEWLTQHLGISNAPLSYVVREAIDCPLAADDPPFGEAGSVYSSPQEEIIARSPIRSAGIILTYEADFVVDNKAVWELLASLCRDKDCWTHVKPFLRKKNGRGAYLALWSYYLGKQNVDNQATTSEKGLELASWSGDSKRFCFDDYVKIHMDHHAILSDLTAHGYAGIDDRSKVRHLLKGIKSCKLDAVKTAILASSNLRSDFSGCVTLYKDYMTQMRGVSEGEQRQIAGFALEEEKVSGGGGSGKGKKTRPWDDITVGKKCDDRYYSKEEYSALSREERFYLRALRDKRVAEGGKRNTPRRSGGAMAVVGRG